MAALRGQLRALRNDRNLRRFVVQATPIGRQLGTGSYGAVEEVNVNGQVCAGKKIHELLLDVGNVGVRDLVGKYVQECQMMSDLRHPNITQFMGVCFLPDCQLPVLVMEKLDGSLNDLLETVPNIPLTLKRSILEDVARGLLYLHKHTPTIVHRDLTAKNVLLTSSLVAKITDFGNSRIVNIQPGQLAQTLSRNPGTLVYMPPEALTASARYGPSLDIFSFGHLGLFVGIQVFPGDLLEPTYSEAENRGRLLGRSEVKRRQKYFEQLEDSFLRGVHHPFVMLVKRCLQNEPQERPTAEELVTSLEEMKADIEGPYGDVTRIGAVREVVIMRALKKRDTEVREMTVESAAKDAEIHQLQQELEHVTTELRQRDTQIHQQNMQVQQKEDELGQARSQLQQKTRQLQQQTAELKQTDAQLNNVQQSLQRLCADLEDREAQLRAQEEELQRRDAEISRLMRELRICQAQLLRQQVVNGGVGEGPSQWSKGQQIKQTPLDELRIPLKLKWRREKAMPMAMFGPIQAVVIGNNVYIGGGINFSGNELNEATVMVYSLQTGSWRTLPPYESVRFGMATVNNQLVLVGGRSTSTGKVTNVLGVWDEGSRTWTHPFPVMPTARQSLSVISYQKWLVVAGGYDKRHFGLETVELLDTLSGQWYEGSPLPNGYSQISSAINGNVWYLSRGYSSVGQANKHVFIVCFDELISQAVSPSAGATSPPSPWQTIPGTPLEQSTLLILNGALLAVGGENSSAIHIYQPITKSWVKVGDLPTQRDECACAGLPSGEIFVAGGYSGLVSTDRVDIATVV